MVTVTCDVRIDDFCQIHGCDRSLDQAKQDKDLCDAGPHTMHCGDYDMIITSGGNGNNSTFYYQAYELVALAGYEAEGFRCAAGPTSFDAPFCRIAGDLLPVCLH